MIHAVTQSGDDASELMPGHRGRPADPSPCLVIVQIRPADPRRPNAERHFARGRRLRQINLLYPQITLRVKSHSPHRSDPVLMSCCSLAEAAVCGQVQVATSHLNLGQTRRTAT